MNGSIALSSTNMTGGSIKKEINLPGTLPRVLYMYIYIYVGGRVLLRQESQYVAVSRAVARCDVSLGTA